VRSDEIRAAVWPNRGRWSEAFCEKAHESDRALVFAILDSMKKRFRGNLKSIEPNKILGENVSDFDRFFLVLGLIFNDMKDFVFLGHVLDKDYDKADNDEITSHRGEYAGIRAHIFRMQISIASEFILFLRKNKKVLESEDFTSFENQLSKKAKIIWFDLKETAFNKDVKGEKSFINKIAEVRSNVSFHYWNSMKGLEEGYIEKFFNKEDDGANNKAYYSSGSTIEFTRPYYCDAAAEEFIRKRIDHEDNDHLEKVSDLINSMMKILMVFLNMYFTDKE
jgi:hypothetical protein